MYGEHGAAGEHSAAGEHGAAIEHGAAVMTHDFCRPVRGRAGNALRAVLQGLAGIALSVGMLPAGLDDDAPYGHEWLDWWLAGGACEPDCLHAHGDRHPSPTATPGHRR